MIKPKVIDLFAGVGGMSLGFEQEGFDVVLANEYDESIANAYRVNHKNTKMVVGDITQLDLEKTFGDFSRENRCNYRWSSLSGFFSKRTKENYP